MKSRLLVLITGLLLAITAGCGQRSGSTPETGSASEPVASSGPVSMNKADYPVFPDADAGADPSVPAEQGGKGFTGKGLGNEHGFRSDRRSASGEGRRAAG